ncbi:MAG: Gfo/Idh/MocA family oxidoreductase [Candidatus Latescibacterota bacterium]
MKRVCLVGCGRMGRMHARCLAGHVELSFHSRTPASARRLRDQVGSGPVLERWEDVLAPGIDALVLASPPAQHAPQAIAALRAGKPVLVEKPLCTTPAELEGLGSALWHAGAPWLMVAENYYYKPMLRLLHDLLRQGHLGLLQEVHLRKECRQQAAGWRSEYGALLEGGIHFVALAGGLLDQEPEAVEACFPGHRPGYPERRSHLRLRYPGGVNATVRYAWDRPALLRGIFQHSRIVGSEGRITFESNGLYVHLRAGESRRLCFPGLADLMGYRAMARDFLRCLEGGGPPLSDFARARRDLNVVFAAYANLPAEDA